jgi:hypothetical protein
LSRKDYHIRQKPDKPQMKGVTIPVMELSLQINKIKLQIDIIIAWLYIVKNELTIDKYFGIILSILEEIYMANNEELTMKELIFRGK